MDYTSRKPHVLDMWYFYTGDVNSSIPFCSGSGGFDGKAECGRMFSNQSGLDFGINPLTARIDCQTHVSVPDYYQDAASNMSSDLITRDSSGRMMFATRVCSCRYEKGLTGWQCTPAGLGVAFQIAFAIMALWLLLRLVLALKILVNDDSGSRRKKILVILAALQHVGQILWLIGWLDTYFIIIDRETMATYTGNLGFTLATLCMFMFICVLTSQTSAFLRKDARGVLKTRLKWIERIFVILPFAVLVATGLLVFDPGTQSRLGLLTFQSSIAISVVSAFSFTIHVLDKRVTRLLPRKKFGVVTEGRSVVRRIWHCLSCTKKTENRAKLDHTSELLLASSRRMRRMVTSLRTSLIGYALFGGLYVILENLNDTPPRIVRLPQYLGWQIILSSIPTVGINGLSIVKPVTLRIFGGSNLAGTTSNSGAQVQPESSSVGTLTS